MFHSPNRPQSDPSLQVAHVPPAAKAPARVEPRMSGPARRPRIAIMGEFSAGKSTLTNLLMGQSALPTRVTATQLPPVWLSHGTGASRGVGVDGAEFPVALDRLDEIDPTRTQYLRVEQPAEVLELCDLIDFPGISDPAMPSEVWQRTLPLADAVLWCTHATQAWRQSEAAAWQEVPEEVRARSLLLLTRIDKIEDAKDRRRVVARLRRETAGDFAGLYPVSLTRALAAGEDAAAFAQSGAQALIDALLDLVMDLSRQTGHAIPIGAQRDPETPQDKAAANTVTRLRPRTDPLPPVSDVPPPGRIVPRRVRPQAGVVRKPRPSREEAAEAYAAGPIG